MNNETSRGLLTSPLGLLAAALACVLKFFVITDQILDGTLLEFTLEALDTCVVALLIIYGLFFYKSKPGLLRLIVYLTSLCALGGYIAEVADDESTLYVTWQIAEAFAWIAVAIHFFQPKTVRWLTIFLIVCEAGLGTWQLFMGRGEFPDTTMGLITNLAYSYDFFATALLFFFVYMRSVGRKSEEE